MNKNLLNFTLNENHKIKVQLKYPTDIINAGYQSKFYFISYNHKYLLTYNFIQSYLENLTIFLKLGLKNQLQPHNNYKTDMGYYWNQALNKKNKNDKFDATYKELQHFIIFDSFLTTFLYNDSQGNIIFEITPLYPYTYAYRKKKPSYGHFLQWIQSYKPLFKTIIPRHVAEQWVMQAQQILDTIDENTQMLHEQGKL